MLYNRCTGTYKFGNNTYPRRIRRRLNLGHIFREKSASYGPGNTVQQILTNNIFSENIARKFNSLKHEGYLKILICNKIRQVTHNVTLSHVRIVAVQKQQCILCVLLSTMTVSTVQKY